jgi:hypothetical protein
MKNLNWYFLWHFLHKKPITQYKLKYTENAKKDVTITLHLISQKSK